MMGHTTGHHVSHYETAGVMVKSHIAQENPGKLETA
jgi:hypothetical protein